MYLFVVAVDVCGEKDDCNGGLSTGDQTVSDKQEMKLLDLMVLSVDRWHW